MKLVIQKWKDVNSERNTIPLARTCLPVTVLDKSWTLGQPLDRSWTPGQLLDTYKIKLFSKTYSFRV